MIAILGWTDGFGNDTYVWGIYPTLEIAKRYAKKELRWVEFDWYFANEFRNEKHKPKKRKEKIK